MPACDHTGTPRHFHSSTTSGSAWRMIVRIRASISPRQSASSLILASISREGESPASFAPLLLVVVLVAAFFMIVPPGPVRLPFRLPIGQSGRDRFAVDVG